MINVVTNQLCYFIDEHLLVGTQQGHLLMYSVLQGASNSAGTDHSLGTRCEVHLLRSNKYFAKKPIQQLAVVPEHQILISLSGILYLLMLICHKLNLLFYHEFQITLFLFMIWRYLISQSLHH